MRLGRRCYQSRSVQPRPSSQSVFVTVRLGSFFLSIVELFHRSLPSKRQQRIRDQSCGFQQGPPSKSVLVTVRLGSSVEYVDLFRRSLPSKSPQRICDQSRSLQQSYWRSSALLTNMRLGICCSIYVASFRMSWSQWTMRLGQICGQRRRCSETRPCKRQLMATRLWRFRRQKSFIRISRRRLQSLS